MGGCVRIILAKSFYISPRCIRFMTLPLNAISEMDDLHALIADFPSDRKPNQYIIILAHETSSAVIFSVCVLWYARFLFLFPIAIFLRKPKIENNIPSEILFFTLTSSHKCTRKHTEERTKYCASMRWEHEMHPLFRSLISCKPCDAVKVPIVD